MKKYINETLAKKKGLITDNNFELYKKVEKRYKIFFEKYFLTLIDLNKYDKKLFNYHYIKKSSIDISNNLDFLCISNDFFVEKLDIEDIHTLTTSNNFDMLFDIIKRTYKDVIKNDYISGEYSNDLYKIDIGGPGEDKFVRNDAIIVSIYYAINGESNNKEEFMKKMKDLNIFLNDISNEIKNEIEKKLNMECDILLELNQ